MTEKPTPQSDNSVDALIAQLADSAEETPSCLPFFRLFLLLMAGLVVYGGVIVGLSSARPDLFSMIGSQLSYLVELLLLLSLALSGLYAALLSGYPDFRGQRKLGLSVFLFFLLNCTLFYGWQLLQEPAAIIWGDMMHGLACCAHVGLMTLPPAIALTFTLKRFASTEHAASGVFIATTAFATGALLLRLIEPIDWMGHIFLWHYIPLALFAALGVWLGPKLLKW